MEAKEFQIGDWVRCDTLYPNRTQITMQDLLWISQGKEAKPIALTAKILDLNCIDYDEDMQTWYIQDGCRLAFEMQEKEAPYVFGDHAVIRYVHELQHILRLCGLKELADNFKVK